MEFTRLTPTEINVTINKTNFTIGTNVKTGDVQLVTYHTTETGSDKNVRRFFGPGEYEAQGVMIDAVDSGEDHVSYHLTEDGVAIAILSLKSVEGITDEVVEHLQPAHVLCLWLEEGGSQNLATILGRFESTVVMVIQSPLEMEAIEKELQLKAEVTGKLKITSRDLASEQRRFVSLEK